MNKKLICIFVLTLIISSGCKSNLKEENKKIIQNDVSNISKESNNSLKQKGINIQEKINFNNNLSKNIVSDISGYKDVKKVTVISSGNNILIGIRFPKNISKNEQINLKNKIKNNINDKYSGFSTIGITTSEDLVNKIENISRDVENRKPIIGLAEEMGSLIRKITPTI